MIYFDKEKGEFVWFHLTSNTIDFSDNNTTISQTSTCLFLFNSSSATIEKKDPPETVKKCEVFYDLVKTTKTPFTLRHFKKGKKYLWTGYREIELNLTNEEIPVNWDIVIAVLMTLRERGEITSKYQHAYIFKLLKQKDCGTGCEKMTMDDYLEKLNGLDKTQYKIPISNKIISKYIPTHDAISDWSVKEGDLQEAQEFAFSFVKEYYHIFNDSQLIQS